MKKISFLLFFFSAIQVCAQEEDLAKRTTIVFITSEVIAAENFKQEAFLSWARTVQNSMGELMKTEKGNHVVRILARWKKDRKCTYDVSICPVNNTLAERVQAALNSLESPIAEISTFELMFSFKFNQGCNAPEVFTPTHLTSVEKLKQELNAPSLAQNKETIRNWAQNEVIPILSHFTKKVDAQFAGVRETGNILEKKSYLGGQAANVTDKNALYWRGVMEMNKGNLIISLSKVFMHVANGEFDLARRYLSMLSRFADKESLATHYLLDLNRYFDIFFARHDSLVRTGIALHDAGKYEEAIKKYNAVLSDYPHSAWAQYELYFSTNASKHGLVANGKKTTELWNKHKALVYGADPLYPVGGGANNAKDGFILFRHMQVKDLFKDSKKLKDDLTRYADIALDVEAYAFAGHLFWYLATVFPTDKYKEHSFLIYYLYSLQKLGITSIQDLFKDDFKKELQGLDGEREAIMKSDPIYKSFKEE
jgi:tetratricopeptide (TPR) repeat protein